MELDKTFLDLAKGAYTRSRAKWLEEGEINSNGQRKTLSALNIDRVISKDLKRYIRFLLQNSIAILYTSNFNYNNSEKMIDFSKHNIK